MKECLKGISYTKDRGINVVTVTGWAFALMGLLGFFGTGWWKKRQ